MIDIICASITAVAGIVVTLLSLHIKHANKRTDERAELRKKESLLSLSLMDSVLQLSLVCANALTNHENNGNVAKAYEAAQKSGESYKSFMHEITASSIGK